MSRRAARASAVTPAAAVGAAAWLGVILLASLGSRWRISLGDVLVLLSPLVIVPIGVDLVTSVEELPATARHLLSIVRLAWPAAAIAAALSILVSPGLLSGALAIALAVVAGIAASAAVAWVVATPTRRLEAALAAMALAALFAGAAWLVVARFGWRTSTAGVAPTVASAHLLFGGFAGLLLAWLPLRLLRLGRRQRRLIEISAWIEVAAAVAAACGVAGRGIAAAVATAGVSAAFATVAGVTCLVVARLRTLSGTWPMFAASLAALAFASSLALRDAVEGGDGPSAAAGGALVARHGATAAVGFVLLGLVAWSLARAMLAREDGWTR
jgi:YndJ-like protein